MGKAVVVTEGVGLEEATAAVRVAATVVEVREEVVRVVEREEVVTVAEVRGEGVRGEGVQVVGVMAEEAKAVVGREVAEGETEAARGEGV